MQSSDFPAAACHALLTDLEPTVLAPKFALLLKAAKFILQAWMGCTDSRHWQACLTCGSKIFVTQSIISKFFICSAYVECENLSQMYVDSSFSSAEF